MHLHTHDAGTFMHSVAASLARDPASLEAWKCIYIHHKQSSNSHYLPILELQQRSYQHKECDVVLCADNDIILLSRSLTEAQLWAIANDIIDTSSDTPEDIELACFDCFRDWHYIQILLCDKSKKCKENAAVEIERNTLVRGISTSSSQWEAARENRRTRSTIDVLIVEDDPVTLHMASSALRVNHHVITAQNAREGLALYLANAPDIVFLDIGLPDLDGFTVLKNIITNDPDAYVVMFSGNSQLDNVTASLMAGASGFVAKPFRRDQLHYYVSDSAMHHHKECL